MELVQVVFDEDGNWGKFVRLADEDDAGPILRDLVEVVEVPKDVFDAYRLASAQARTAYGVMADYADEHAQRKEDDA